MKKKYLLTMVVGASILSGQAIAQIKQIDCEFPFNAQEGKITLEKADETCASAGSGVKDIICKSTARMKAEFETCMANPVESRVDRFTLVLDSGKFGGTNVTGEYSIQWCGNQRSDLTKRDVEITPSFLLFNRTKEDRITINREKLTATSNKREWNCSVKDVEVKNKI